jgi:hypothetical protein
MSDGQRVNRAELKRWHTALLVIGSIHLCAPDMGVN